MTPSYEVTSVEKKKIRFDYASNNADMYQTRNYHIIIYLLATWHEVALAVIILYYFEIGRAHV